MTAVAAFSDDETVMCSATDEPTACERRGDSEKGWAGER
jgi:hypothetical protein